MKNLNVIALIIGFGLFVGSWMPLATVADGSYYMSPIHIGGPTYLVYLLPFVVTGLAILGLVRPSMNMFWWYLGTALFGGVVVITSIIMALNQLEVFLNYIPDRSIYQISVGAGRGAMAMVIGVGLLGILTIFFTAAKTEQKRFAIAAKSKPEKLDSLS